MMQFGEYLTTCSVTAFMILKLTLQQVVAAHARLARHAGGDDDDVGVGGLRVVGAVPITRLSDPSIGHDSSMSSAMPAAF